MVIAVGTKKKWINECSSIGARRSAVIRAGRVFGNLDGESSGRIYPRSSASFRSRINSIIRKRLATKDEMI